MTWSSYYQLSIGNYPGEHWLDYNSLHDWSTKPHSHSLKWLQKKNQPQLGYSRFPAFKQFSYFYFEFSWALQDASFGLIHCCDYFGLVLEHLHQRCFLSLSHAKLVTSPRSFQLTHAPSLTLTGTEDAVNSRIIKELIVLRWNNTAADNNDIAVKKSAHTDTQKTW